MVGDCVFKIHISPGSWISPISYAKITSLCKEAIHPATVTTDFEPCSACKGEMDEMAECWVQGKNERQRLSSLYWGRKRPVAFKNAGIKIFLLDDEFLDEWRRYIK